MWLTAASIAKRERVFMNCEPISPDGHAKPDGGLLASEKKFSPGLGKGSSLAS